MPKSTSAPADSPSSRQRSESVGANRYLIFALLAAVGCGADLWSKHAIFAWLGYPGHPDREPIYWVIEGYFGLETAINIGAVFGLGAGQGHIFATLSVIAAIAILIWLFYFKAAHSLWLTIALGCVMGGIFGNLYDRLGFWYEPWMPPQWQSGVRDWILWQASPQLRWPNFNIADSLLVTGAIMLILHSLFLVPPAEGEETASTGDASTDTPPLT